MDRFVSAETSPVFGKSIIGKRPARPVMNLEMHVQKEKGVCADHVLRQRLLLNKKKPPHVLRCEFLVRFAVHGKGRNDVHPANFAHGLGMVEAHPMSDSRSSVMRSEEEGLVSEFLHYVHLVPCHRAERVVFVPRAAFGLT